MQISRPVITIIVVLSIAIAGFTAGSFAGAYVLGEPGSEYDPLIAESYLKEAVDQATSGLKNQIGNLQEQIEELRLKLEVLEVKAGSISTASREQTTRPKPNEANTGAPTTGGAALENKPDANTGKTGTIIPDVGARLRTGPSAQEYDIIKTLVKGTKVEILNLRDGWYEVKLQDNTKGWVLGELIKLD